MTNPKGPSLELQLQQTPRERICAKCGQPEGDHAHEGLLCPYFMHGAWYFKRDESFEAE
jgi:hypothetical protein